MHYHVYVPHDLCRPNSGELIGYRIHNTYVVIQRVSFGFLDLQKLDPDLLHIGLINSESSKDVCVSKTSSNASLKHTLTTSALDTDDGLSSQSTPFCIPGTNNSCSKSTKLTTLDSEPVTKVVSNADSNIVLHLQYEETHKRLLCNVHDEHTYTLVSFSPPNLRNLEYFTVRPILLQSTGQVSVDHTLIDKLARFRADQEPLVCEDSILDKVNRCQKIRSLLSEHATQSVDTFLGREIERAKTMVKTSLFYLLYTLISWLLVLTVPLINALNNSYHGITPVQISAWCKQFELRLRQISYFPIQFLCYYDTSLMSSNFLEELELPESNLHHNINNSNYINLYNSLWLIVNDILIGTTLYRLYVTSGANMPKTLNKVLADLSFVRHGELIAWVGSGHPGGFKLNNELGRFLESMFMWTLEAWKTVFHNLIKVASGELWVARSFRGWFVLSCCCGVSFSIAALIDYVNLVTLHIYYFNIATTKIFHRQMAMLKSLTQLFRGKKYNVLRNRIDNLDDDQFHVDQLLMGTFIFMILIYLLPTIFAFYLLFFCSRVVILTVLKLGDKCIVTLNLYPLFVVLLKLKNSRRLQGGIYFEAHGSCGDCNWLTMENKALTFDEILRNFVAVFRQEGRFKRLAMNFVEGVEIIVKDTRSMKFHYLMLPGDYNKLIDVWQSTNVSSYH